MSILQRIESWGATHHPKWLVVLRVVLGICLFIKGISFISDTAQLEFVLAEGRFTQSFHWLSYVIIWLHLFGGFMIIIGLFTRLAVALQIPILLGAVFFINISGGVFASSSEFWLSILILLLLIVFFIEGGGPLSLDHYFRKRA